jgi:ATP/ADP translocase
MNGFFWVVGGGVVLFAAVVSYAMTRRYGWGAALALPVMALVATLGMQWQERASTGYEPGLASLALAAPVLLGAVAGIAVARLRRG